MFYVYKITNKVNGKVYVGKTNDIERRYKAHIRTAMSDQQTYRDCVKFYRSIRKYGVQNFSQPEVLGNYDNEDDAYEAEKRFIEQYDSFHNGMNACPGGRGVFGSGEESVFYLHKESILDKRAAKKNSPEQIAKRFWSRVEKTSDGCWIWTGGRIGNYGTFRLRNLNVRAHQASWEINVETIPESNLVAHSCDNTLCVNPSHLYLTTRTELSKEINEREERCGSNNTNSKLTEELVREMRTIFATGTVSKAQLARQYKISETTVRNILSGKKWKSVI